MGPDNLEEIFLAMQKPLDLPTLKETHSAIFQRLEKFERSSALAMIGAMLCDASLQSNCLRLEALAHIALLSCQGVQPISENALRDCFAELGKGICGRMEDPAEDVFVSLVHDQTGNYRVLEGIWESGSFYLQRVLDVVAKFPEQPLLTRIGERVKALLILSDAVCERIQLDEFQQGQPDALPELESQHLQFCQNQCVIFSLEELASLGLSIDALDLFSLVKNDLATVEKQELLTSMFQRYPIWIAEDQESVIFCLPTATTFAIRSAVCNLLLQNGFVNQLLACIEESYQDLWYRSGLLGLNNPPPLPFARSSETMPSREFVSLDNSGTHIHFYFLMDDIAGMPLSGIAKPRIANDADCEQAVSAIAAARDSAIRSGEFTRGLTLIIFCGVGRGVGIDRRVLEGHDDWNVEFISAADFDVLNHKRMFSGAELFRLFDWQEKVADLGIQLHNNNGLLNLIAYQNSDEVKLFTSNEIEQSVRHKGCHISIGTNFIVEERLKYWQQNDYRRMPELNGGLCLVRRIGGNRDFGSGNVAVHSKGKRTGKDGIPFVVTVAGSKRCFWCHSIATEGHEVSYNEYEMVETWARRCVPVINSCCGDHLPEVVQLVVNHGVDNCRIDPEKVLPKVKSEIEDSITVNVDGKDRLSISLSEKFYLGLRTSKNISERALVRAICGGFFTLANLNLPSKKLDAMEAQIVTSDDARQVHSFVANAYRDRTRNDLIAPVVHFTEKDVALLRLGVAFRVEPQESKTTEFSTAQACTGFLNKIVEDLEREICESLKSFNKQEMLLFLMRNYESAKVNREIWMRTGKANIALNDDQPEKAQEIVENELKANNALLPCRLLIEMGVASCREEGGQSPSELIVARLMAKAYLLFQYGGWSNSIRWNWMPPRLLITALGDIHAVTEFESNVLRPFAERGSRERLVGKYDSYEENFKELAPVAATDSSIHSQFEDAIVCEFGFSITEMREFLDALEDWGEKESGCLVFTATKSQLISALESRGVITSNSKKILDHLMLRARESFRTVPETFVDADLDPWRFGRALSLNRRPIVAISKDNENVLLAPGLVRESVVFTLTRYFNAEIRFSDYRSEEMRRWDATKKGERGDKFVDEVIKRLEELGWKVLHKEKFLSFLLGYGQDEEFGALKDLGDVDILAFHEQKKRVLAIECKHLQFKKTPGEIAEQLNDYRGQRRQDGSKLKKDELKKHLDRIEALTARREKLVKHQKLPNDISIEGWIVFRHPVPMLFCWEEFKDRVAICVLDTLEKDLNRKK